ncbi:MAG: Crp/Fnr family transcriptional regulator [Betaproteobacteria bacterium]|jgi:CRP-like cAMP-binding protein|nr:Crp/Fnr family transcriptional regulator [Betaproteobacteria bacterium]
MANPKMNDLLASLPDSELQVLLPLLQLVSLTAGETLAEAGRKSSLIYFPINALVAHSREMSDGMAIDTSTVGAEGMLGCGGLIGTALHRLYVAQSGLAYRIDGEAFMAIMSSHPIIADMCTRGVQLVLRKISIELTCCHFHSIHQRVARWILSQDDCNHSGGLAVTHQTIASSLGVRREAVSLALPKMGGCSIRRGHLEITDRSLLEKEACECYFQLKVTHRDQRKLPFSES